MNSQNRLVFQKGDILAIALVVFLAVVTVFCFLPKEETVACEVQIYQNGQLLKTLDLTRDQEMTVSGKYRNTIAVMDGKVSITASDCPGEDCVHSGAISAPGRSIVCLPNGVEVRVTGKASDVDFVVG